MPGSNLVVVCSGMYQKNKSEFSGSVFIIADLSSGNTLLQAYGTIGGKLAEDADKRSIVSMSTIPLLGWTCSMFYC